ncbi:HU family DNA-binding protein [Porphyromonas gingivalis]|uniref:HU family DNA-binding protein n=1 Tax=Porphyromonas gingivalis TaxID=837 RepID=UPI00041E7EED|nr:HU family DNA-binding protein [Porphyromonas gingivalis]
MLNLSVKSRLIKIGKHKDKTMYYAQVDKPRVIEYEDVIKDIAEMSSLTTGDVRNAIDRLAYYLQRELTEGNTVRLGQIGTFRVSVPSKYVETEKEVNASILKKPRIRFYINNTLSAVADNIRLAVYRNGQKVDDTTSPSTPSEGGGEQPGGSGGL